VKLIHDLVALLRNNSSLLSVPATSFCIFLVLATRSHLSADDLYFFLSAAFALCAVLDGGLPYRIAPGACNYFSFVRVCRRVLTNLLKAAPLVGFVLGTLIWLSPFTVKSGPGEAFAYVAVGLGIAITKVLTDTARVASLKSEHRITTDQLTTAFGVFRLLVVMVIAGELPYLPVLAATLLLELTCLARINGVAAWTLVRAPGKAWRRRFRCDGSYLKANFAYNVAFNIDRLVAFYFLLPSSYRMLIGVTSLFNMAILPHKLVENELLFPSTTRANSNGMHILVPSIFCGVGCAGLVIALHLLSLKFGTNLSNFLFAAAALWVFITAYYNRLWSISLRDFKIEYLAKVNLAASVVALISAALGNGVYGHFVPAGLLGYSIANFVGLFAGRLSRYADIAIYFGAASAGTAISFCLLLVLSHA
jgi:hypothetical protein